jgi:hypothetical protein
MDESEILPAPVINVAQRNDDKWERERSAFHRLLPNLLTTSQGKYVAIHDGSVVETGDSSADTAQRAYARFGYVPIFIGLVSDQGPRIVRIPSPRVSRHRTGS